MIVLTVVTAPETVRVGLGPLEGWIGWARGLARGFPTCTLARSFRGSVRAVATTGSGWSERSFAKAYGLPIGFLFGSAYES
jgi:hypothetical protein